MNQQLIHTFLDILETRNFNRTADRLNITQSTVSARIRQLEEELNTRLFERGRGGAEPTVAGRRFEAYSRSFLTLWGHAKRDVGLDENKQGKHLNLSVQYSLIRSYLLDWIDQIRLETPDIALHIEINFSAQIQRDILAGQTDIGIIFAPQQLPDLFITEIGSEEFVMVSTKTNQLANVQIEDYIKIAYTEYFERFHDEQLQHLMHPKLSAGSDDMGMEFLKRYGGTLYLPKFVADAAANTIPNLQLVQDSPIIPQPMYSIVHLRKRYDPQVINALKGLKKFYTSR